MRGLNLAVSAAIGSAWAMEEGALVTLFEIAHREHDFSPQALEAMRAEKLTGGERAKIRDGVAILYVEGPLFKRANLMTDLCGATSYDVLMRDLATAKADGNVRAIMLAIDSPGGEAAGCNELATAVRAARGSKPIVAYVADVGASAAYWIASAADRIVCGPSASLGSIGVRSSMADTRERDAKSGVRRFEFVSSQSPFKVSDPATEDGNARIKARVDALAQVFVEAVASNRDVSVTQVLDAFGRGDVLIGSAAVRAGMADALGSFESVLADLTTSSDPFPLIGSVTRQGANLRPASVVPVLAKPAHVTPVITATPRHTPAATVPPRIGPPTAELARIEGERTAGFILSAIAAPTLAAPSINDSDDTATAILLEASGRPLPRTSAGRPGNEAAVSMTLEAYRTSQPDMGPGSGSPGDEAAVRAIMAAWRENVA